MEETYPKKPKIFILFEYSYKEGNCTSQIIEMHHKRTFGKGPTSNIQIDEDPDLDDPQFELVYENNEFNISCQSKKYFTLYKLPPRKKVQLANDNYFLLSDSEGFLTSDCYHGNISEEDHDKFYTYEKNENNREYFTPNKFKDLQKLEYKNNGQGPTLRLKCIVGAHRNIERDINLKKCKEEKGYRIGRKEEECDLCIPNNSISMFHINIHHDEKAGFTIQENNEKGSLNGSYIGLNSIKNKHQRLPSKPFYLGPHPNLVIKASLTEFTVNFIYNIYIYIYIIDQKAP